jgi:hypothetical protein
MRCGTRGIGVSRSVPFRDIPARSPAVPMADEARPRLLRLMLTILSLAAR